MNARGWISSMRAEFINYMNCDIISFFQKKIYMCFCILCGANGCGGWFGGKGGELNMTKELWKDINDIINHCQFNKPLFRFINGP
jgi:hypothetical protein